MCNVFSLPKQKRGCSQLQTLANTIESFKSQAIIINQHIRFVRCVSFSLNIATISPPVPARRESWGFINSPPSNQRTIRVHSSCIPPSVDRSIHKHTHDDGTPNTTQHQTSTILNNCTLLTSMCVCIVVHQMQCAGTAQTVRTDYMYIAYAPAPG